MNKTFDSRRFWQTLKWTVISEKKSIITAAIAFAVAFLAIQLFSCFTIFDISRSLGEVATFAAMATCAAIIGFMAAYYASGILGNARTGQQRATALMLPASNLEKFTVRIVYCCIVMLLLLYVAALAATGLRMLLELIAGHDEIVGGIDLLFGYASHVDQEIEFGGGFNFAMACWSMSLFVLGGVFFSKRPFVWTFVTLIVGSLVLFTLLYYIGVLIGEDSIKSFLEALGARNWTKDGMELTFSLILLAFTVFNVWLSYRLFCRLQVVQHKWFNV